MDLLTATKQRFESLYRRAHYQVMLETSEVTLVIDHYDALAELQLRDALAITQHWVIITPCNPRSIDSREELNNFYMNQLRDTLSTRSGDWAKAVNVDPMGEWPDEPGFFVVDPDMGWIMDLGRRFGQNALVHAKLGQPPGLIWLI